MNKTLKELYRYIYKHKHTIKSCKEYEHGFELRLLPSESSFHSYVLDDCVFEVCDICVRLSSNPEHSRVSVSWRQKEKREDKGSNPKYSQVSYTYFL